MPASLFQMMHSQVKYLQASETLFIRCIFSKISANAVGFEHCVLWEVYCVIYIFFVGEPRDDKFLFLLWSTRVAAGK